MLRYLDRFPERHRESSLKSYWKKKKGKKMFEIEIADEGTIQVVEVEAESAQDALDYLDNSGQFSDDALALSVVEK